MTPTSSNYPNSFDNDENLFVVHDSLRVRLAEDYNPGDTSIVIEGDEDVISKFPPNGIITLTEQCSEPEFRAISLFYGSRTASSFDELEVIDGFIDVFKPKRITNVMMNVFDKHHNHIKNALISIETFIGIKGTEDTTPFGPTLTGRLNYLRRLILTPRAWFSANKRIGIAPVTVEFVNESFRNPTSAKWDFGDGTSSVSNISSISSISSISNIDDDDDNLTPIVTTAIPCGDITPLAAEDRVISKTYYHPGKYTVGLEVGNKFGRDSIVIDDFFIARAPAPDEAEITINPTKVKTNTIVSLEATDTGEQQDEHGDPVDAIIEYTWKLNDDIPHDSATDAVAIYSVGGIYDVKLRVDTELGAYRITTMRNAINVVEDVNLWLLTFDSAKSNLDTTKDVKTYEFGLISESFKSNVMPNLSVTRDHSFIDNTYPNREYQRNLFLRNNGFAPKGNISSGNKGEAFLYWQEEQDKVRFREMNPFNEVWSNTGLTSGEVQTKNWNWFSINTPNDIYMLFGLDSINSSPTTVSSNKSRHSLSDLTTVNSTLSVSDYINGADELLEYPDSQPATYRSCFRNPYGYLTVNDAGPGGFFRIRNFYRLESSTSSDLITDIRKLDGIPGTARTEAALVSLSNGVYVFNNSGEVAAYDPTTNVWTTGGPGVGSTAFRTLQDTSVSGYSDMDQPLLATSDGDHRVYLSFDYTDKSFVKFNEVDLSFVSLGVKPNTNEQFLMHIF